MPITRSKAWSNAVIGEYFWVRGVRMGVVLTHVALSPGSHTLRVGACQIFPGDALRASWNVTHCVVTQNADTNQILVSQLRGQNANVATARCKANSSLYSLSHYYPTMPALHSWIKCVCVCVCVCRPASGWQHSAGAAVSQWDWGEWDTTRDSYPEQRGQRRQTKGRPAPGPAGDNSRVSGWNPPHSPQGS